MKKVTIYFPDGKQKITESAAKKIIYCLEGGMPFVTVIDRKSNKTLADYFGFPFKVE